MAASSAARVDSMKGVEEDEDRHLSGLLASVSLKHGGWQRQPACLNEVEELPVLEKSSGLYHSHCLQCATYGHRQRLECASLSYYSRTLSLSSNCLSNSRARAISSLMKQLRQLTLLILLSLSLLNQITLTVAAPLGDEPVLPERCQRPFSDYDCGGFQETRYTYRNGSCHMAIEWMGPGCEYDGTENSFASKEDCEDVCTAEEPSAGNLNPPMMFPPLNDAQPSMPTATSLPEGTAGGDPLSTTDPSTVDTSVCLQPLEDITCSTFSFPTTYYYYDADKQACQSRISFCPIDLPGYFEMREECLDTCERPLNPPTTTSLPPTTTTSQPPTTTPLLTPLPPQTGTSEPDTETTNTMTSSRGTTELVSTTTHQKTSSEVTTTTSVPATPTTTPIEQTTERTLALATTTGAGSPSSDDRTGFSFTLNKFDVASLALGVMAVVLILVLVVVISLSMYARHTRLRRQKQEVMDSKKSEVRTLAFTATRQEKSVDVKHTSMSSTASTISSYLTTV